MSCKSSFQKLWVFSTSNIDVDDDEEDNDDDDDNDDGDDRNWW